ncbi:hypothetical protein CY35_12G077900 [Sphagnum magellanicum]|nr:hypothetical protein CY35_12G077900 [Sphagnum magellanicum]
MIVRTYQRRHRIGRSLSDGCGGDGSSQSQDSPWCSSQEESGWWQSDHGNTTPSLFSDSDTQEGLGANLVKARSLPWTYRNTQTDFAENSITDTHSSIDAQQHHRFGDEFEGRATREGLVRNNDNIRVLKSFKDRSAWSHKVTSTGSIWGGATTPVTSTLLEAQESGEMMEHMDEANFALDGLRPEQPLQIQRASLQSVLSLCGSMQRRRILRTHSLVKPLLDAVVALPTDDSPLALAAAAVLYFLALDGQNEELFDSVGCVQFLMRLLGSSPPQPPKKSSFSIGNKLAGLGTRMKTGSAGMAAVDQGGAAVVAEVHELFAREEKIDDNQDEWSGYLLGQELTAKWLALLTLEKACLSTVVLEDNSGAARKADGFFKERLRELGGLDTICNLAASCLCNLQDALEEEETEEDKRSRGFKALEKCEKNGGVGMLLRCLRVMENVTFLSELNQRHLLELRLRRGQGDAPASFVGLVISTIKVLSELAHCQKEMKKALGRQTNEVCITGKELTRPKISFKHASSAVKGIGTTSSGHFNKHDSAGASTVKPKGVMSFSSLPDRTSAGSGDVTSVGSDLIKRSHSKPLFRFSKPAENLVESSSGRTVTCSTAMGNGKALIKRIPVSARSQHTQELVSLSSGSWFSKLHEHPQKVTASKRKESLDMEDSQDPFAFDEVDLDLGFEKGSKKKSRKAGKAVQLEEVSDASKANQDRRENSVANGKHDGTVESSISPYAAVYNDCLLSAVKVLMNLTNDNPIGCCQVAVCGGLGVIASLLVAHFPSPQSGLQEEGLEHRIGSLQHGSSEMLEGKSGQADQDLDLVVVALGVLCNLVEKDEGNRARLATLEVDLPSYVTLKEGSVLHDSSMIALLCALFLSKHGAGEAAEAVEEKIAMEIDVEEKFKQGEREAEDMIVEAYAALLLAFLSRESDRARFAIAQHLPGDDLTVLVPVLERFVAFHLSLNMLSQETHRAVKDVIDSCRQPLLVMPLLT